jgi:hypothetical protein
LEKKDSRGKSFCCEESSKQVSNIIDKMFIWIRFYEKLRHLANLLVLVVQWKQQRILDIEGGEHISGTHQKMIKQEDLRCNTQKNFF